MQTAILVFGVIAFAGCSSSSAASSVHDAGAPDAPVTDPGCKEGATLDAGLSGEACVVGATCHVSTLNQMVCPDGYFASSAPNQWSCACPGGTWQCQVVGGGFYVPSCVGHGLDAAVE